MRWSSQFARFLVAGAFNTAIGYLLYLAAIQIMDYRMAYTGSYAVGIVISYLVNSLYVFRERLAWRKFLAFPAVYLLQYVTSLGLLWLLVSEVGVPQAYGPLMVIPATIPLTFVASRFVLTSERANGH